MKNMFPGHYAPTADELKNLWEKGTFVFDTSVLLDLYSYAEQAREEVMKVLGELASSSWIPYLVMSEFHRNRYSRINSGNDPLKRLEADLRKMSSTAKDGFRSIDFERRNTGITDLDQRLDKFENSCTLLISALVEAKKKLPMPGLGDDIAGKLASMYEGRIGVPPVSKADLDELLKDGEKRFSDKVPPGFKDSRTKDNVHRIGGLSYEARFGDLIIWRQMINYAKSKELESIVFVTAERKEDWWQKGIGGKDDILGPLPELVEEFTREANVKFFWIYSIEEFLQIFKDQADKDISSATISEVKAVSLEQESMTNEADDFFAKELNSVPKMKASAMKSVLTRIRKKGIVSKVAAYLLEKFDYASHEISDEGVLLNNPGVSWYYKVIEVESLDLSELEEKISSPLESFLYSNVNIVLVFPPDVWKVVEIDNATKLEDFMLPIMNRNDIYSAQVFVDFARRIYFVHEIKSSSAL